MLWKLLGTLIKLFLSGAAVFYAGLVLIAYKTGANKTAQINWRDPIHAARRAAVWAGVLILRLLMRIVRPVLNTLEDTSADLGDWVLHHR